MFHTPFSLIDVERLVIELIVIVTTAISGYEFIKYKIKKAKRRRN